MISINKLDGFIGKTERIILELDLDDPKELQDFAKVTALPKDKSLTDYLTKEQVSKVDEMTKNVLGIPFESLKNSHPIVLQTLLLSSQKSMGCNPPGSYELSLMQWAATKKIPIEGLGTVASQMDALNKTPLEKQTEGIYQMVLNSRRLFCSI